jgi:cell division cycle 2-like protein
MPKRDRWDSDEEEEKSDAKDKISCEANEPACDKELETDSITAKPKPTDLPPGFHLHNPLLDGCRTVYDSYERLEHLDEGTYGVVWKARDYATDEIVALKQIKFDDEITKEGFPISALREIGVLLALNHECIVTVREMVVGNAPDKVFMVMACYEMDLQAAMKKGPGATVPFAQSEVKFIMHQLLSAIAHVHENWYLHRDVKTSNILVHRSGRIALCDFGLARKYEVPARNMTQMVVTLWYRAPELLFGESKYGPEIDLWR